MVCWNTPTTDVDRNKLRHGISGGIKTAPLLVRQGQGLEIKLAAGQPFNNEHGTGAHRTSQMSGCVRLVCAGRAEQVAAA
jgi:hypothetical protein